VSRAGQEAVIRHRFLTGATPAFMTIGMLTNSATGKRLAHAIRG
jgi:hypothetical protein